METLMVCVLITALYQNKGLPLVILAIIRNWPAFRFKVQLALCGFHVLVRKVQYFPGFARKLNKSRSILGLTYSSEKEE